MSPWLLLAVSAAYAYTGIEQMKNSPWWLGFWFSYAAANIFYLKATGSL